MVDVPDYLLERSRDAMFAAKGKYRSDDPGSEASAGDVAEPEAPEPVAVVSAATSADASTEAASGIPEHLLERSRLARAASSGEGRVPSPTSVPAVAASAAASVATAVRPSTQAAAQTPATIAAATAPERTQRLLAVVKAGSIQTRKKDPADKVNTWPHLLVIEFVALLAVTAFLIVFSVLVNAPIQDQANPNLTPNPSKAPWYFLGLQELLTVFHPMVAGVTIPGIGIFALIVTPYIDRNPATKPSERKFAIVIFTFFLAYWAILTMLGMFFRGPGFNFVFPWEGGIFFDF